jgi:hypothetical protein
LGELSEFAEIGGWGSNACEEGRKHINVVDEGILTSLERNSEDLSIESGVLELLASNDEGQLLNNWVGHVECNSSRLSVTVLDQTN